MGICGIIRLERNIVKVYQHKVVILAFPTVEFNPYLGYSGSLFESRRILRNFSPSPELYRFLSLRYHWWFL
jgi:hypothetical protein